MRYLSALLVLLLLAGVCGEVSQEDAGKKCEAYLSQYETASVSGPISCDGTYWICDFDNYGKTQAVIMAVDKYSGVVLERVDDATQLEAVVRTKYLVDIGGSSILQLPVLEENFIIQVMSLNGTFANRRLVLDGLKANSAIRPSVYLNLSAQLDNLQSSTRDITEALIDARNESATIMLDMDCSLRDSYMGKISRLGPMIENFTEDWRGFVVDYNAMAASLEVVVTQISTSSIELFSSTVGDIEGTIENYLFNEDDYADKVLGNIGTRQRKLESEGLLEDALAAVESSDNEDAVAKYNDAVEAYNEGSYLEADKLSREAISLSKVSTDTEVVVVDPPKEEDYTVYFLIIAVLLGALVFVLFITRRGGKGDEGDDRSDVSSDWAWEGGKKSSLEKAAD